MRVVVIGGTGQIGRAVARRLADDGAEVTVVARSGPLPAELETRDVRIVVGDRSGPALHRAVGNGVDVLVDVIPYTSADARRLISFDGRAGSVVAVSSASVYADGAGRSMDAATGPDDFPRLPLPVSEGARTVTPGEIGYSARKAMMERTLLDADAMPVTIIRPCAVHGVGARSLREWHFIRRVLDGRPRVVMPNGGRSMFHTTAAENLAELVRLSAGSPGHGILNCGDPDPPTVADIANVVARAMGHDWDEVLLPGPPRNGVGDSPWEASHPVVLDMAKARSLLGYRPVVTYQEAVNAECAWLTDELQRKPWQQILPDQERFGENYFDYAAEDAHCASL